MMRNPKSETRNPKQILISNDPRLQTARRGSVFCSFEPWCFGFVSDFGFRIRGMHFIPLPPTGCGNRALFGLFRGTPTPANVVRGIKCIPLIRNPKQTQSTKAQMTKTVTGRRVSSIGSFDIRICFGFLGFRI